MIELSFFYGKTKLNTKIPKDVFRGEMLSSLHNYHTNKTKQELVVNALETPIGISTLRNLANGKK